MTTALPVWARRTVYLAGGLLFLAGAALSGWSLTLLAEQCGIPRWWSVTLPLALDAGAATGVTLWVAGADGVQRQGRRAARLLFALSVVGNASERLAAFGLVPWPAQVALAVGVSVVFPLLAYLMSHLVLLVRHTEDAPKKVGRGAPTPNTRPGSVVTTPAQDQPPAPAARQPDMAALVVRARKVQAERRQEDKRPLGRGALAARLEITPDKARQVIAAMAAEPLHLVERSG